MGKDSFKVFFFLSIATHLCIIFLVGNLSFKHIKDKNHTLRVEITSLTTKEEPRKENTPKKSPPKLTNTKRTAQRPRKSPAKHIKPSVVAKSYHHRKSSPQKREDTILLNTRNPKYVSYSSRIKRKIELAWQYPSEARKEETQGRLTLMFSILRGGNLVGLRLLQSSGFQVLDNGAMNAVRHAAPYYPIPQKMEIDRLNIMATFEYRVDLSP